MYGLCIVKGINIYTEKKIDSGQPSESVQVEPSRNSLLMIKSLDARGPFAFSLDVLELTWFNVVHNIIISMYLKTKLCLYTIPTFVLLKSFSQIYDTNNNIYFVVRILQFEI